MKDIKKKNYGLASGDKGIISSDLIEYADQFFLPSLLHNSTLQLTQVLSAFKCYFFFFQFFYQKDNKSNFCFSCNCEREQKRFSTAS